MELPDIFKIKTMIKVDWYDLEEYITKCFNLPKKFEILESPNDTVYEYNIDDKPLSDYDKQYSIPEAEKALSVCGAEYYSMYAILLLMREKGFLIPGNYLVDVCW